MFPLEVRKQHTKYLTTTMKDFMYSMTNNHTMSAYYIVLVHWIVTGIPLAYITYGDINWFFYVSCAIWVAIFGIHFYFAGCICTRIERTLWGAKDWWGPWIFFFLPIEDMGIEMTSALANNIFICWGIWIALIAFVRMLLDHSWDDPLAFLK